MGGPKAITYIADEGASPVLAQGLSAIPATARQLEAVIHTSSSLSLLRKQLSDGSLSRLARSIGYDLILLVDLKNPDFVEVSFKQLGASAPSVSTALNLKTSLSGPRSNQSSQRSNGAAPSVSPLGSVLSKKTEFTSTKIAPLKSVSVEPTSISPSVKSTHIVSSAPLSSVKTKSSSISPPISKQVKSVPVKPAPAVDLASAAVSSIKIDSPKTEPMSALSVLSREEQLKWLGVLDGLGFALTKKASFLSLLSKLDDPSIDDGEKLALCRANISLPVWRRGDDEHNYRQFYSYMAALLTLANSVSDGVFNALNSGYNAVYDEALEHGLSSSILDIPSNSREIRAALKGAKNQ